MGHQNGRSKKPTSLAEIVALIKSISTSAGDMLRSVYDPNSINGDVFSRGNHTGVQPISSVTDLSTELYKRKYASAGRISGLEFTDNLDGTVTVTDGVIVLNDSVDYSNINQPVSITGATLTMEDNAVNYIYCDTVDNLVKVGTFVTDESSQIAVYTVIRTGIILHILDWGDEGNGKADKINKRIIAVDRYSRESGFGLSVSAGLKPTLLGGIVWMGCTRVTLDTVDVAGTDKLTFMYKQAGVWKFSQVSALNNTQYQGATDLVALTASSRYAVNWLFRGVEDKKHLYLILGTENATLHAALDSQVPADVPALIARHAMLVGRVIVQKDVTTPYSVASAFTEVFTGSSVTSHNNLASIQGGSSALSEYYHMTSAEYARVQSYINNLVLYTKKSVANTAGVFATVLPDVTGALNIANSSFVAFEADVSMFSTANDVKTIRIQGSVYSDAAGVQTIKGTSVKTVVTSAGAVSNFDAQVVVDTTLKLQVKHDAVSPIFVSANVKFIRTLAV